MTHTDQSAVPLILYGTAFKDEKTTDLVVSALDTGFKGIDTAAVTRAYKESLVGEGIREILDEGKLAREDIFIQSKFSPYTPGKDPTFFPYDVNSEIEIQVASSVESSLKHFTFSSHKANGVQQLPYLDSVILHSPYPNLDDTVRAWKALEEQVPHNCRFLGLSNIGITTLRALYDVARVKPVVVQNRFTEDISSVPNPSMPPGIDTPDDKYDTAIRGFCQEKGILYQPWGILWGTPSLLKSDVVKEVAAEYKVENEVALYLCFLGLKGTGLLIGTKNEERMKGDLESIETWRSWLEQSDQQMRWDKWMTEFQTLLAAV